MTLRTLFAVAMFLCTVLLAFGAYTTAAIGFGVVLSGLVTQWLLRKDETA